MIEAYTNRLMMPGGLTHEIYLKAVTPPTNENKYQIAERLLREALPVFRLHYKEDNRAIFSNECRLSYTLVMQQKWKDLGDHLNICKQGTATLPDGATRHQLGVLITQIDSLAAEKSQ